ncbi:MAG: MFS transporter, partial [Firmicutes bacterium]|nr:MFS transporter [Bacillota bacterium]
FTIVYGLTQPIAGTLMEKYHSRVILSIATILMAVGMIGMIYSTKLWHVHLLVGLFTGIGFGALGTVPTAVLLSRWFRRKKGTAIGAANAGGSIGRLIFPPLSMWLVLTVDWRYAFLVMGILLLVPLLPMILALVRNNPADMNLLPDGVPAVPSEKQGPGAAVGPLPTQQQAVDRGTGITSQGAARHDDEVRVPIRAAMRTRPFWLLVGSFMCCGFTGAIINMHFVIMAIDWGIRPMVAAQALGVIGAVNILGLLATGSLSDRFGRKIPLGSIYILRGLSFLLIVSSQSTATLFIFAVLYGLSSFSSAPPTSSLVGDIFGSKSVGTLLGLITMGHQIFGAVGTYLAALVFESTGSYSLILQVGILILVGAAIMSWLIPEGKRVIYKT